MKKTLFEASHFIPHVIFWGFFMLLFKLQNPTAEWTDYMPWMVIMVVSALIVYTNLYLLFPKYLFSKKYIKYAFFITALLCLGAYTLKLFVLTNDPILNTSYLQHLINLFFFVLITSSLKFIQEYFRKQKLLTIAENEQLKAELSLLKSQINPHFLFNTLNNLYGLILHNQNSQAAEISLRLSDLMRYILESNKSEKVSLHNEGKFIEDYLLLEKIRFVQQPDIQFKVTGLSKDFMIAPLLFIPIVENVFKHGLQTSSKNSFAFINLSVLKDEILFEVENSVGTRKETDRISGTGISNLQKRLKLVYPYRHKFKTELKDSVFKVRLQIQL